MKYLSNLVIPVLLLFFVHCNNSNTSPSAQNADPGSSESAEKAPGDGSFSAKINGDLVSGGAIDELQLTNNAFIYPAEGKSPEKLLFFLNTDKKGDDFYSFRFSIPNKQGVYKFTSQSNNDCHCSLRLDYNLKSSNNFSRYDEDEVAVSIDKVTNKRISGTFSGRLKLSNDTRSQPYAKEVNLSEGQFDIPFSTGKMRPE